MDELDVWFKREVLPHEGMLLRYLARVWPHRDDLDDLCQESLARVYEAALAVRPHAPKALLFAIARNIMTDRLRRERVVSIQAAGDNDFLNDLIEEKTPERWVGARQELARLAQAFDSLPAKCREVVWLRRVQELPQKEVARRLGISEKTVENQVSKGSRLLARYMQQGGAESEGALAVESESDGEDGHGHG